MKIKSGILLIFLSLGIINAQDFKNLKTDKTVNLNAISKNEIYLDVWATWCLPCRKSLPILDSIAKLGKHTIATLNVDDDKSKALAFLKRYKLNLEVWINPNKKWLDEVSPRALPSLYVINNKGEVVKKLEAYTEEELKEFFK